MKRIFFICALSVVIASISLIFSGCYTQLSAERFDRSVYAEHSVEKPEAVDTNAVVDTTGYDDEYQPDYASWYYYYPRWNSSWYDGYAYAPPGAVYEDGWCYSGFYSPWWWGPVWYSPFYFGYGWYGHPYGYGYHGYHGYHGYFGGGGARSFGPGRNSVMARSFGAGYGRASIRGFGTTSAAGNVSAGRTENTVSRNSTAPNAANSARQVQSISSSTAV